MKYTMCHERVLHERCKREIGEFAHPRRGPRTSGVVIISTNSQRHSSPFQTVLNTKYKSASCSSVPTDSSRSYIPPFNSSASLRFPSGHSHPVISLILTVGGVNSGYPTPRSTSRKMEGRYFNLNFLAFSSTSFISTVGSGGATGAGRSRTTSGAVVVEPLRD